VSASNDASTAGTKIRTRAFIKFLLPFDEPRSEFPRVPFLREPMEEIKKVRLSLLLPGPRLEPLAPRLAPVLLPEPEVEADRQDDQVGEDAGHHQDAGCDLLVDQRH